MNSKKGGLRLFFLHFARYTGPFMRDKKEEIKMMEFVLMTLSFTLGILFASGLALFIMMQPKVMKAYMKMIGKTMSQMDQIFEAQELKDL